MTIASRHPISARQRGRAKSMRRAMTDAERTLWSGLRAHRLAGLSFRRQVPIGPFIADFVCQRHRLIIELDGGQHAQSKKDVARDQWLASKGCRVLRFWNSDVLSNRTGVLETILSEAATPLPDPPPQGGRECASASGEAP